MIIIEEIMVSATVIVIVAFVLVSMIAIIKSDKLTDKEDTQIPFITFKDNHSEMVVFEGLVERIGLLNVLHSESKANNCRYVIKLEDNNQPIIFNVYTDEITSKVNNSILLAITKPKDKILLKIEKNQLIEFRNETIEENLEESKKVVSL